MKNNSTIVSCLFFVSFLLFHVLQAHSADRPPSSKSGKESHLLQAEIQKIARSIKLKENQLSSLQKKIYSSDTLIEKLGKAHLDVSNKQVLAKSQLSNLYKEKSQLLNDIASSNQSVAGLMRAFYLLQRQRPLKSLINQEDVGKTGRFEVYHDYLIKDYLRQYRALSHQYEKLDVLEKSLSKRVLVLDKLAEKILSRLLLFRSVTVIELQF
ncbi:MAG: hypothetical protein OEM38_08330 [Gammaproteobacteria bacterium]|nr:hypothetical protein [Gammaproteobacteria bacterium]